jgi:hypothetical protein
MKSVYLYGREESLSPQTTMAKPEKSHAPIAKQFGSHIEPDNGLLPGKSNPRPPLIRGSD